MRFWGFTASLSKYGPAWGDPLGAAGRWFSGMPRGSGDIVTTAAIVSGFCRKNRADFEPFAVGDAVTVLSEAGELNNGRVFPAGTPVRHRLRRAATVSTSPVTEMVLKFAITRRRTH